MDQIVPNIEENIPLPQNAKEAFPELSPAEELQMRANVIKLMSDLTGQELSPTKENAAQATELARQMASDPKHRPEFANYPNETLAFLAGMVAQMNVSIVEELSDFKLYVVNKLVHEIEHTRDPKARLTALRNLGEVDGVDAFKKKTEVTHKIETMEEVEKELLAMLSELKQKALLKAPAETIDAEVIEDDRDETETNDN
jgi:hypothetical protein